MVDIASANNILPLNTQPGMPPIDPTQYWVNPFNISRSEKDALIRTLRQKQQSASHHHHPPDHEFKPQPPQPNKKPRRGSRPLVPRDNVSPERARHLERNRIAANKCRLKKKREHEQIQTVLNNETARRDTLLAEVDHLKEEIWHLKNRIFEHAKCDDQQIDLQLAKMTQSVLDGNASPLNVKCPSPSFSVSTWSDGSVGDAGGAAAAAVAAVAAEGAGIDASLGSGSGSIPTEASVYEGYPEGIFDSFVDVPNM